MRRDASKDSPLLEIALLLVGFDHVASFNRKRESQHRVKRRIQLPKTKETFIHRTWTYRSNRWKKPSAYGVKLQRLNSALVRSWEAPLQALQRTETKVGCLLKHVQQ